MNRFVNGNRKRNAWMSNSNAVSGRMETTAGNSVKAGVTRNLPSSRQNQNHPTTSTSTAEPSSSKSSSRAIDFDYSRVKSEIRSSRMLNNSAQDNLDSREFLMEEDDEVIDVEEEFVPSKTCRIASSEKNMWIPANLVRNSCFDRYTGAILNREDCINNLNNAMKNKKSIDFYEILKLSQHEEIKGSCLEDIIYSLTLSLFKMEKIDKNRSSRAVSSETQKIAGIFNLDKAMGVDKELFLPGGQRILITSLLTPSVISTWVGKTLIKAVEKSIVSILDEMICRDEWFLVYTVTDSGRPTRYIPLPAEFIDTFAQILQAGFEIHEDSFSLPSLASTIKESLRNFIGRRRKHVDSAKLLHNYLLLSGRDPFFRSRQECIVSTTEFVVRHMQTGEEHPESDGSQEG